MSYLLVRVVTDLLDPRSGKEFVAMYNEKMRERDGRSLYQNKGNFYKLFTLLPILQINTLSGQIIITT